MSALLNLNQRCFSLCKGQLILHQATLLFQWCEISIGFDGNVCKKWRESNRVYNNFWLKRYAWSVMLLCAIRHLNTCQASICLQGIMKDPWEGVNAERFFFSILRSVEDWLGWYAVAYCTFCNILCFIEEQNQATRNVCQKTSNFMQKTL